jgi:hypothetical protein
MGADPEPEHSVGTLDPERPMPEANAHEPEGPHAFEMEGRMPRIGLQAGEGFVGGTCVEAGSTR